MTALPKRTFELRFALYDFHVKTWSFICLMPAAHQLKVYSAEKVCLIKVSFHFEAWGSQNFISKCAIILCYIRQHCLLWL